MGYLFQNITDLADFLLSRPETSRTGRNASSPVESGFFDFESALKAMSFRFGNDIAGIENTPEHSVTPGAGETRAGEKMGYETAEPAVLSYRTVELLLSKSDDRVSMEISPDDLALLLNKKAISALAGGIHRTETSNDAGLPRFLEPLNSLKYQAKHRITFAPVNLSDNIYPVDGQKIPVNVETPGLSSQPEYVSISELVSLIKGYPDPVKMEVSIPLENDPSPDLKASMQDSNMKLKAAFAFDLRQLFQMENTSDNAIRGLLMFSGKQNMANVIHDTINGSLLPESAVADNAHGISHNSTLTDNFNGSIAPPWHDPMDLLRYPLISHRSYLFGFGAVLGRISNPIGRQTLNDPAKGMTYIPSEFDNPNNPENPGRLDSRTLNTKLSDVPSGSKNIFNSAVQGKGADIIGESILSYARGETSVSKTPAIEMTEPRLRPVLNLNELGSGILYAARRNLTQVTLKLYPEKLGTVSVRLFWRGDLLSADMKAANVEAAKILSAGLTELKSGLERASLKVENLNVILDNGKDAGAFGSSIDARSHKPGAELEDDYHNGNRQFSSRSTAGNHRKNLNRIMHVSTHRGWIDLHA